jgi:hypothetical protein
VAISPVADFPGGANRDQHVTSDLSRELPGLRRLRGIHAGQGNFDQRADGQDDHFRFWSDHSY